MNPHVAIPASESHRKLCDQRFQKNRKKKKNRVSQPYVSVTKAKGEKRFDKRQNTNGVCYGSAQKSTHTHTKSTHTFLRLHFSAKSFPVSQVTHAGWKEIQKNSLKQHTGSVAVLLTGSIFGRKTPSLITYKLATAGIKQCHWFFHWKLHSH